MNSLSRVGACLYPAILNYSKSNGLPILSFLKLVRVKLERNTTGRHGQGLPSTMANKQQNLYRIENLLIRNNIDQVTITSHKIFNEQDFQQFKLFLKNIL